MAFTVRILTTNLEALESAGSATGSSKAFCDTVRSLRPDGDVLWVAFSSRSRRHSLRLLSPFQDHGRLPDFLIVRHSHIYRITRIGYVPCLRWNIQVLAHLILYPLRARKVLDAWYEDAVQRVDRLKTLIRTKHHLRLRFNSMEDADASLAVLGQALRAYRHVYIFRKDVEVEIRPVPFIKGLTLRELCAHLHLDAKDVLTIAYGRSDLSLIDKDIAARCGCAANSDPRILHAVHDASGHVARSNSLAGVIEVLRAYRDGQVCSELPAEWKVPKKEMSLPERPWNNPHRQRIVLRCVVLGISLYLILAIFASFDLVPLSDLILKPCKAFATGIGGLFGLW